MRDKELSTQLKRTEVAIAVRRERLKIRAFGSEGRYWLRKDESLLGTLPDADLLTAREDALQLALPLLDNAGVHAEAEVAVKKIAEAIKAKESPSGGGSAETAASRVMEIRRPKPEGRMGWGLACCCFNVTAWTSAFEARVSFGFRSSRQAVTASAAQAGLCTAGPGASSSISGL